VATDITTSGNYFLPILDDEVITKDAFRTLKKQWRHSPVKLAGMYAYYQFDRSHLPDDEASHCAGHHSLCVRTDTFVPGVMTS
jgi:hypothetical protein